MNFEEKNNPEIYIAPENKPIQPPPKRKFEDAPMFFRMKEEDLIAIMCSTLRFKYDPFTYKTDQKYKSMADSILFAGMIAMMTHYLRSQGVDVEKFIGERASKVVI